MNPTVASYLIVLVSFSLTFGGFFLAFSKAAFEKKAKATRTYLIVGGIISILLVLACLFTTPIAILPIGDGYGSFNGGIHLPFTGNFGLIEGLKLVGFICILLYVPCCLAVAIIAITDSPRGKLLNRFMLMPLLFLLTAGTGFIVGAWREGEGIDYKLVMLSISIGSTLALSTVVDVRDRQQGKTTFNGSRKILLLFLFAFLFLVPTGFAAVFTSPSHIFFWEVQGLWRIEGLGLMHRTYIYGVLLIFVALFYHGVDEDEKTKKMLLLFVCIGALASYVGEHGLNKLVPDGTSFDPTQLPLHLCDLLLILMPLVLLLRWKRLYAAILLFGVVGGVFALLFPSVGYGANMFDGAVLAYWRQHFAVIFVPILALAWKLFERVTFKRVLLSELFYLGYFVLAMVGNGILSNFRFGFNPTVIGSGTDYFFLNGTRILSLFGNNLNVLINTSIIISDGTLYLVYYPFYQLVFLFAYALVAPLTWGFLALVHPLSKAHAELRARRLGDKKRTHDFAAGQVYRLERYEIIDHELPKLVFDNLAFSYEANGALAVDHLSFTITKGKVIGFLGEEGSGKSTCLRCACGLLRIQGGRIEVCGYDIEHEPSLAKKKIGCCLQNTVYDETMTGR
ncbi:MAG: YwaF family protein, partial [Bacilli bacterium]|nr:YwaF family protein [Bacilli bacterium]